MTIAVLLWYCTPSPNTRNHMLGLMLAPSPQHRAAASSDESRKMLPPGGRYRSRPVTPPSPGLRRNRNSGKGPCSQPGEDLVSTCHGPALRIRRLVPSTRDRLAHLLFALHGRPSPSSSKMEVASESGNTFDSR